jgi:hypothetical protein
MHTSTVPWVSTTHFTLTLWNVAQLVYSASNVDLITTTTTTTAIIISDVRQSNWYCSHYWSIVPASERDDGDCAAVCGLNICKGENLP